MKVAEIRHQLKARGLKQAELAQRLGVSHNHLSQLLSGKRRMRVDTMQMIEEFLARAAHAPLSGVRESSEPFTHRPEIKFISLDEAKALRDKPPMRVSDGEFELIRRELRELGEALKRAPRLTNMTDDEILGYNETQ